MVAGAVTAASTVCVALLLWGEYRDNRPLRAVSKPAAAAGFISLALVCGATESTYGSWLLAGLIACSAGDVFLLSQRTHLFLAGLSSFLLGHLLYVVAFLQLPFNATAALFSVPAVILLCVLSLRWLWPHLAGPMRFAVPAYILVIGAMLLAAGASWGNPAALLIVVGGWGFAISDLSVARDRFIAHGFANRVWGLPLYFGSQLLLATTPAWL